MRVLACGSRDWTDWHMIRKVLEVFSAETTLIHGRARGADTIAATIALEMGFLIDRPPTPDTPGNRTNHLGGYPITPADWNEYRLGAGPRRNGIMLKEGKPDLVIAFTLPGIRGTRDMLNQARAAGVECREYAGAT